MANFKPQVRVITQETNRAYHWERAKSPHVSVQYPTYKKLVKNLQKHLVENLEPTVTVTRSKRGEWGEWFEKWELRNGKPTIIEQGWN